VTPKEILAGCRLENIKHLWKFSRLEYDSDVLTNILNYLLKIKSEKLLSVVNHFPTTPSTTMYSHLFYLIYHHKLKVEMNLHYISPNSEVYIDL